MTIITKLRRLLRPNRDGTASMLATGRDGQHDPPEAADALTAEQGRPVVRPSRPVGGTMSKAYAGLVGGLIIGLTMGVAVAAVFINARQFGFGVTEGDSQKTLLWQGNGSGDPFTFAGSGLADIPNGTGNTLSFNNITEAYMEGINIRLRTDDNVAPTIKVLLTLTDNDDIFGMASCSADNSCASVGRTGWDDKAGEDGVYVRTIETSEWQSGTSHKYVDAILLSAIRFNPNDNVYLGRTRTATITATAAS